MHCVEQEKDREKLRFSPSVTVVQQKKIDFPGFKLKTEKVLEAEAYVYTFVPNIRPIRAFTYTISMRCEKPIIQYPFFRKLLAMLVVINWDLPINATTSGRKALQRLMKRSQQVLFLHSIYIRTASS